MDPFSQMIVNAVSMAKNAVVKIDVYKNHQGALKPAGAGSGFIFSSDGMIFTNNHVVEGMDRITIKLTNGLSAKLDHRDGYYADKIWGKFNAQDKEQRLMEALTANTPVTELPLAIEIDYFRVTPTSYYVPVSVKVPGSVIALAQKSSGAGETQFDFLGQIQDERRNVVGNVRDYIKIKVDSADAEKLARRNFHYDAGFTLSPGRYHMKFLVRENQTGKMGTFETSFKVPDLAWTSDQDRRPVEPL